MSDIREFLRESEIGSYQKTFPTLSTPTLGTDAEGYMKTIAEAAIEQIRFLNTFSGVPLEVLFENVGQRHKASNLLLLSTLQVTETAGSGEGLDMIRMAGETSGSYESAMQAVVDGGDIDPELWTAQNNLLTQQNAYLDDIKTTFQEKREELNAGFSMKQFTQSNTFKFLADMAIKKVTDWVTDAFPGVADDAILDTIAKYAPLSIGWGLVWLHKQFLAGAILCERMKEENTQLLTLTASIEMYKMRSDILSQHDVTIQSLLSQVALVETQIGSGNADIAQILDGALYAMYDPKVGFKRKAGLTEQLNKALFYKDTEGLNEDIGIAALIKQLIDAQQDGESSAETVIQCPHTGDFIFSHSRGKMTNV